MVLNLTAVTLVARHDVRLAAGGARVSAFLDTSPRFSCDDALARGSATLLTRVLTRAFAVAATEPLTLHRWVWTTLQQHIAQPTTTTSLALTQSLVAFVHPSRSLWDAVAWAVAAKDLETAQWLYDTASTRYITSDTTVPLAIHDALLREAVLGSDVAVTRWALDLRSPSVLTPATSTTTKATRPVASKSKPSLDLAFVAKGLAVVDTSTAAKWEIVELLLERLGLLAHRSLPLLAAQQGRLHTLQRMATTHSVAVVNAAAANGHFDIVAYYNNTPPTHDAMDDAAMAGHVDVLQKLYTQYQCVLGSAGVLRAADQGHVAVLAWAWTTFPDQPYWRDLTGLLVPAFTAAVDSGRLAVVTWLYATHLERLLADRAVADRRIVKTESVYLAFQYQHVDVVKFIHAHGLMDWDQWEGGNAAYYCELPTLQWLHANGLMGEPRNELTSAVFAGRLDCIQWILANRPIEPATYAVEYAAMHGRLDVLELLLARGLTGSFRAIDYAAARGHVAILRRLMAHHQRHATAEATSDMASPAAIHGACLAGHLDVVTLLTEEPVRGGTCTTAAMDAAASKGFVDIVAYLHTHRTEGCTVAAMDAAATNGDMAAVAFLHANRSEGCSVAALEGAAVNGHFAMVQFLVAQYPELVSPKVALRARAKGELEIALWLEQCHAATITPILMPVVPATITTERVLPPATPIVG